MKKKNKIIRIYKDHLSEEIQKAMDNNGFTIYKNVMVVWGEGGDKKVIMVIDQVTQKYPDKLLMAHLEGKSLEMVWNSEPPAGFDNQFYNLGGTYLAVVSDISIIPA